MSKFMVLYSSTISASNKMANSSLEQMKVSVGEWMKWRGDASKTAKIDFVPPLEAVSRIASDGVTESSSRVSGYCIVEGESKVAILELLRTHPHLKISGASVDVFEMLAMPGV